MEKRMKKVAECKQIRITPDLTEEVVKIMDWYSEKRIVPPSELGIIRSLIGLGIKKFWEDSKRPSNR